MIPLVMKMRKNTAELSFELEHARNIHTCIMDNETEFDSRGFADFLSGLISQSGKTKNVFAAEAGISVSYLYNILKAEKQPTRNSVFKLAIGLKTDVPTAERMLKLTGYGGFYMRRKRDVLLWHSFRQKMTLDETNAMLTEYNFAPLGYD